MKVQNVKISKRLVLINAVSASGARIINVGVILWAQHYLLTRVSAEEFSLYPVTVIWLLIIPMISNFFSGTCQRFVVFAFAKGDTREITEVVSTVFPLLLVTFLAVSILTMTAVSYIDRVLIIDPVYVSDARWMLFLIVVPSSFALLLQPFTVAFFAHQRLLAFHAIGLGGEILRVVVLGCLFMYCGPRVVWVVCADAITKLGVVFVRFVWSRKMMPELTFWRDAINWHRLGELMQFGTYNVGIDVARFLNNAAPIWLLNRFTPPVELTSFHIGRTAYRQTMQARIPIQGSVGPPLIAMSVQGQQERLRNAYYRGGRLSYWLIMSVATPLMVFRNEVIELYAGEQYAAAATVMLILLLQYPVQLMNNFLPQVARAKGEVKQVATVMLTSSAVLLLLVSLAARRADFGAIAVALCSLLVTFVTELFFLWPVGLRLVNGNRRDAIRRIFLPGIIPSVAAAAVWFITLRYYQPSSLGQLLAAWIPGGFAYMFAIFLCLQPEDEKDVNAAIRVLVGGFLGRAAALRR